MGFEVGQRVIAKYHNGSACLGVIEEVDESDYDLPYKVRFGDPHYDYDWFHSSDVHAPSVFEYDDIIAELRKLVDHRPDHLSATARNILNGEF